MHLSTTSNKDEQEATHGAPESLLSSKRCCMEASVPGGLQCWRERRVRAFPSAVPRLLQVYPRPPTLLVAWILMTLSPAQRLQQPGLLEREPGSVM